MVASWTWRRTGGQDGDRTGALDGDQSAMMKNHIMSHMLLHLMLLCESYLCASIRYTTVA